MSAAVPTMAIVMPAYNEHERIGLTLEAIARYAARSGAALPILVGDDGSTDDTGRYALAVAARLGLALEVRSFPHRGKALTVRDAMLDAADRFGVEYLLMLDADNEISIGQLDGVAWQKDPATIYIGRRVATANGTSGTRPALVRRVMSSGMRTASRLLLGMRYPDTQCGFKLFPRALVTDLFRQQTTSSWVFDAEILTIAGRVSGLPICEIPVTWAPRGASRVRATAAVPSFLALLGVAARLWSRRYRPLCLPAASASERPGA